MKERNGDGAIKVLLADDHTMFREGLARMLASYGDMEVIGEITNDEEAVELAREERPTWWSRRCRCPSRGQRRTCAGCASSRRPRRWL